MPRNLDLLPEKELFDKSSSIVEYVRDCKIDIQYKAGDNWCKKVNNHEYKVNIATPTIKHIPKYTALIHELAHILYQSPFYQVDKLMKDWENTDFYFNCYNLLEDERIESHLKREYLAYGRRFNTTLRGLGQEIPEKELKDEPIDANPIDILFAIRCMRTDRVFKTRYFPRLEQAMEDVKGTDKYGALRILITIKDILDDYLEQRMNQKEKAEQICSAGEGSANDLHESATQISDSIREETSERTEARHERRRHISDHDRAYGEYVNDIPEDLKELANGDPLKLSDDQREDLIETGKELGEEEYNDIQETILAEAATYDNTPSSIKRIERETVKPVPDYSTANKLNRVFKHLQMGLKPYVDYQGHDVNFDAYINNIARGVDIGKSFTNMKSARGGSILISIDASSSMKSYSRIDIARNLVATLYKSLENVPNIELKGNIWGSDGDGSVGLTEIKNISDVENVTVTREYNGTPTHLALEYSAKTLKEMRGNKKLMIVVTDGVPNYWKNGVRMQRNHYHKLCKKSYAKAMRVTPNIVFVVINPRLWVHESMKELFGGKNIVSVPNAELGSEKVIKQFRNIVMSTLV